MYSKALGELLNNKIDKATTGSPRWRLVGLAALLCGAFLAAPGPSQAQSLTESLVAAYGNNPDLRAARAQVRVGDEDVAQAISNWRPRLSADLSYGAQHTDTQSAFFGDKGGSNPKNASLNLIQPIYRGGQTVAGTEQAELQVLSLRASLDDIEQSVLFDSSVAYLDVWRDQSIFGLTINNERVLRRQLEASRDRFEVGEITRTDVAQSESRLATATGERIAAQGSLQTNRGIFQRLVGLYPGELVRPVVTSELPGDVNQLIEVSIRNAPAVAAARWAAKSADKAIRTAKGSLYPQLQLRGTLRYQEDNGISETETKQAEVFAELSVPIYQQGAVSSSVRQAAQLASQRRAETAQAMERTRERAITAWESLETARAQIVAFQQAVRSSEIALEGVRQENAVGERTILDILDAEQELLDAQVNLVRAQRDEQVAVFSVLRSMGAYGAADLALPVTLYNPEIHYRGVRNKVYGLEPAASQ